MKAKVLSGPPELIEHLHEMGFKDPILVEEKQGLWMSFLSNSCYVCDRPWTVKCYTPREADDEENIFHLCDEHLRHAREKWPGKVRINYRRDPLEFEVDEYG